jgi:hypothetical protein
VSEEPEPKHRRGKSGWDPTSVIALVIVVGAFSLAAISIWTGHDEATIPAWVAALVGGVGIYYYKMNGNGNGKS